MAETRTCSKCCLDLDLSQFAKHGEGRRPDCKGCRNAMARAYYESNKEAISQKNAAYRGTHKAEAAECSKRWRINNRDRCRENSRAYVAANREKQREYSLRHYRKVALINPESYRVRLRNRHARKKAAGGSHTAADILELKARQRGKCVYCRLSFGKKYHVDHVTPLARGGGNDKSNLQLLCPPCNQRKWMKDPIAFAQEVGLLL